MKTAKQTETKSRASGGAALCRFCKAALSLSLVDLGTSPLCQTHITPEGLDRMEAFYPLHAYICGQCFLAQLRDYVPPEDIFTEYAYFSSYSETWLDHVKAYTALMIERFRLGPQSRVVEIASNDGYLLQYFVARGVPVLGIDPAANVAEAALRKGVPTRVKFFGEATAQELAAEGLTADLIAGNNVLAHVPDLNGFVRGMKILLKPRGVITMEFPHLQRLMERNQFDTIYHEHYSYFSFHAVERIFMAHGLTLFDVEELPTHGGSLRIYARHAESPHEPVTGAVAALKLNEAAAGMLQLDSYRSFGERVKRTKRKLLEFLIDAKEAGKSIAGYGAPGKGNTLLNYCGIRTDFLDYTVDRSPYKQGKYTPGTRIPIREPETIRTTKPDYLLILPWNLREEIMRQVAYIREWGGKFVVPIPEVRVYE